jgi:hypothetical protein
MNTDAERASETSDSSNAHRKDAGHHPAPRGQKAETDMKASLYPVVAGMLTVGSAQTAPPPRPTPPSAARLPRR